MSDSPREYDRAYETPVSHRARKRLGYNRTRDEITRFVVQLEYSIDDEWHAVVRYDHDAMGQFGHDVSEEGIHIDIYRGGEKYRTEYVAPPMPAKRALDRAEDHLANNLVGFYTEIRRMARDRPRPMTDEEIEALREDVQEVREEVREDLAADFGGDPDDYRADKPIPDGGDS